MNTRLRVFKQSIVSFFTRQTFFRLYQRVRYKNMSKRQKITFICLITILPSLAILLGILLSCIYGIDYRTIAIGVNQSTQRYQGETTYHNQVVFLSLATSLKKFPSGYFQISFSDGEEIKGATNYPSIPVRALEGTPLKVDLYVKGKLNTGNYTAFHMKYGDDWMFYLRQKIPNVIIRSVSTKGFYDLTSSVIVSQVTPSLSFFDEFQIDIVNLRIQLPSENGNITNGTIGYNVYQHQSQLIFLKQSYKILNQYITTEKATLKNEAEKHGGLKAQKDKVILDNSIVSSTATSNYWHDGMTQLNGITTVADDRRKILWYYFQSYYNSSFNTAPHQIQFS